MPYTFPRPLTVLSGILAASTLGLAGCSSNLSPAAITNAQSVSGNWQVASVAASAGKLPLLSGELTGSASAFTGILHPGPSTACVAPSTVIEVSGTTAAENLLTLTGKIGGGTLSISGTLAEDGKSLTAATYNVTGGTCAFSAKAAAIAQSYSSVTGTYTGSFSDSGGQVISVVADLTQTPQSDTDGNFTLSGTGTFPNNPCFSSPVTVSNAQVTGGSFSLTYADPSTLNSVTANGTFSTDAKTLSVTSWTLTGSCGPDTGTGSLTRP